MNWTTLSDAEFELFEDAEMLLRQLSWERAAKVAGYDGGLVSASLLTHWQQQGEQILIEVVLRHLAKFPSVYHWPSAAALAKRHRLSVAKAARLAAQRKRRDAVIFMQFCDGMAQQGEGQGQEQGGDEKA